MTRPPIDATNAAWWARGLADLPPVPYTAAFHAGAAGRPVPATTAEYTRIAECGHRDGMRWAEAERAAGRATDSHQSAAAALASDAASPTPAPSTGYLGGAGDGEQHTEESE